MKKSFFYGYAIVFVCFLLQIFLVGPRNSFGVFIKPITEEFDWSRALVSGAFSLSTIMLGLSSVFMGAFNDRVGPRIVTTICGVMVGSGMMLMFFVHSAWQLYLFYSVLLGLGMGGVLAPLVSTINRWFVTRRNIMLGLLMAGGGLGGIIGPLLITRLIYTYDWRTAFLYVGIAVFIVIILLAQFLKRAPSQVGQTPYQKGNEARRKELADVVELSLKQALRTWKFWLFSIMMFCAGFCVLTITVHIVPLATDRGISATSAAVILSVMNLAMTFGSLIIGLIADRIGSQRMLLICQCLFLVVFMFLLPVNSAWVLGTFAVILSFSGGGIGVLEGTIIAELFGLKSNGVILGVNFFIFTIGCSTGAFIAGSVFDSTGNYQWAFLLCGALVVVALIFAIFLNRATKTKTALAKG
jgi:MFS family permease